MVKIAEYIDPMRHVDLQVAGHVRARDDATARYGATALTSNVAKRWRTRE